MREKWRPIPGYFGYEASDQGRIRSLDRVIVDKNGREVRRKGCILQPATTPRGHLCVVLGNYQTRLVHAAVMLAFVGPYPEGLEVLHRDHNPANNRLRNLRYGTRSENIKGDIANGVTRLRLKVRAVEVDGCVREFGSVTEAAAAYGLKQPTVTKAIQKGSRSRQQKVRFELG